MKAYRSATVFPVESETANSASRATKDAAQIMGIPDSRFRKVETRVDVLASQLS